MTRGVRGIKRIVDEACKLNDEVKAKTNRLNLLKSEIKRHALITENRGIKGDSGYAVVTTYTKSSIDALRTYNALNKNVASFLQVVNVVQNKLSTYLEKERIEELKDKDTDEYGRVHLRTSKDTADMKRLLRKLDV